MVVKTVHTKYGWRVHFTDGKRKWSVPLDWEHAKVVKA